MKLINAHRKYTILKLFSFMLALILGWSVFVGTGIANAFCGAECCCPSPAAVNQFADAKLQKMNFHNCCSSGASTLPCGLDSGRPLELPQIILGASAHTFSKAAGSWYRAAILATEIDYLHSGAARRIYRTPDPIPGISIYLQNLALLI